MSTFATIAGRVFDALLAPFAGTSPWPAMIWVALLTTVCVLLVFKFGSNQQAIRRKKNRMLARLLEMVLFEDLVVTLGALRRMLAAQLVYLGALLVPLGLCLPVLALLLSQSSAWFAARPVPVGARTVLTARLSQESPVMDQEIALTAAEGIAVEAGPIRAPARNTISWRLRVDRSGPGWVDLAVNGTVLRKQIVAGSRTCRVSPTRARWGPLQAFGHAGEPALTAEAPVERIRLQYPERRLPLGRFRLHWLATFLLLTLLFGLVLKGPLRVTV